MTISVASYNVDSAWRGHTDPSVPDWSQRVVGISMMIKAARPDVVGVQEAPDINVDGTTYSQASDIATLTGYARFQPANGATLPIPIFYRSSGYKRTADGYKVFEDNPYPNYGRAVTWVKLQSNASGRSFFVFNTHFMVGDANQALRERESVILAAEIKKVNPGQLPAFVTGDFNDSIAAASPQVALLKAIGYGDTFDLAVQKIRPEWGTYNGYRNVPANPLRIDHVYVGTNSGIHVTVSTWANLVARSDAKIGGLPPSDHDMIEAKASFG